MYSDEEQWDIDEVPEDFRKSEESSKATLQCLSHSYRNLLQHNTARIYY